MTKPLVEVRRDDVAKLFQGVPFRRSLREAATFTKTTYYESAFCVARDLYRGPYYVSGILEGATDNCKVKITHAGELAEYDFGRQNVSSHHCYRFLGLHFHPDTTKCPIPSYGDLGITQIAFEDWQQHEQMDVRPIITIAHVLENDKIVALIYQKKAEADIVQMQDFKELYSDLSAMDFIDPGYVVDCLEGSKLFHADILTLEKKHGYRPKDSDYHKLRRFVHTPRRRATTDDSIHQPVYMELYS